MIATQPQYKLCDPSLLAYAYNWRKFIKHQQQSWGRWRERNEESQKLMKKISTLRPGNLKALDNSSFLFVCY